MRAWSLDRHSDDSGGVSRCFADIQVVVERRRPHTSVMEVGARVLKARLIYRELSQEVQRKFRLLCSRW